MMKLFLLTVLSFCSYLGSGIFNNALASNVSLHNTPAYIQHELKPIPNSFQLAKATFLPDYAEGPFSGYKLDGDYNQKGNCDDEDTLYTKQNCTYPKAVVAASSCPFLPGYYTDCKCLPQFKLTSCKSPYILGGDSCEGKYEKCVCPATVSLVYANDKCTQYCEGKCIKKSCSPTANQTGCTNGTQSCDDGCGGTSRKCCIPCTNKITSKPENSSYTYSSCTDGNGTKQIQNGWKCNKGYHEKNGECEKDCISNNCSGYPLSSCPTNANCSKCTITATNCSTDGVRYKIDSCNSGYILSGNSCRAKTCEEQGQKTCNGSCIATSACCGDCPSGKKCSNGTCIDSCTADSCSGYTLSSCPTGASCSSCTIKNSDCSTGATKYKKTGCKSGYKDCNGSCISKSSCCGTPPNDRPYCVNGGWDECSQEDYNKADSDAKNCPASHPYAVKCLFQDYQCAAWCCKKSNMQCGEVKYGDCMLF